MNQFKIAKQKALKSGKPVENIADLKTAGIAQAAADDKTEEKNTDINDMNPKEAPVKEASTEELEEKEGPTKETVKKEAFETAEVEAAAQEDAPITNTSEETNTPADSVTTSTATEDTIISADSHTEDHATEHSGDIVQVESPIDTAPVQEVTNAVVEHVNITTETAATATQPIEVVSSTSNHTVVNAETPVSTIDAILNTNTANIDSNPIVTVNTTETAQSLTATNADNVSSNPIVHTSKAEDLQPVIAPNADNTTITPVTSANTTANPVNNTTATNFVTPPVINTSIDHSNRNVAMPTSEYSNPANTVASAATQSTAAYEKPELIAVSFLQNASQPSVMPGNTATAYVTQQPVNNIAQSALERAEAAAVYAPQTEGRNVQESYQMPQTEQPVYAARTTQAYESTIGYSQESTAEATSADITYTPIQSNISPRSTQPNMLMEDAYAQAVDTPSSMRVTVPTKQPTSKKSVPNIFAPKDEAKSMRKSLVLKPTSVKKAENYCAKNGGSFNELIQTLLDNFIDEYGL